MPGQLDRREHADYLTLEGERDTLRAALKESEDARAALRQGVRDASIVTERALALVERADRVVRAALSWVGDPSSVNRCMALMEQIEKWQTEQPS